MAWRWSYGRPTDIACSLSGGDAAFVSGNGARLVNGNPGAASLLTWPSGAQTTSTAIYLDLTWGSAVSPSDIGIFGCTLPVGTLVTFSFKRSGDTGYPYNVVTQRLVQRPHGERVAIYSLPLGLSGCIGARIMISNDVNGSALIAASTLFTLGELWLGQGAEPDMAVTWSDEYQDATTTGNANMDLWQQFQIRGTVRRVRTFAPADVLAAEVMAGGSRYPQDLQTLFALSDRYQRIVHIPIRTDASGYSPTYVNQSAIFGVLTKNAVSKHLENRFFSFGDVTLTEIPIPA